LRRGCKPSLVDETTQFARGSSWRRKGSFSIIFLVVRATLPIDSALLRPGLRLGVAVSGGADSVALLRAIVGQNLEHGRELGLVLCVVHLHHGLRGSEADDDLAFVRGLAARLNLPFYASRVDAAAEARPDPSSGKAAETIEEAARRLRYAWFRRLLKEIPLDAIATAHTLDDQAETVLAKFLRGAWTEGLSGIHPVIEFPEGQILRPLLNARRVAIEGYLHEVGQPWREDSSNRHLTFTRNRIRHELLPLLEDWNPRLRDHLAQMACLARDDEAWWEAEVERLAPELILSGRPVRGGGRAATDGLAIDIHKLSLLPIALERRIIRHAAKQLGVILDFPATEALRGLALSRRAGQKVELAQGLRAERSHRELRLTTQPAESLTANGTKVAPELTVSVPGEVDAPVFGLRLRILVSAAPVRRNRLPEFALLRAWKAGDRVRVHHSSRVRKVKEVLEHMKVTGSSRLNWPVLEYDGRIVWMQGIELEPEGDIRIVALPLDAEEPALQSPLADSTDG
jgi:tRNA(Ile)-lysidine synthase